MCILIDWLVPVLLLLLLLVQKSIMASLKLYQRKPLLAEAKAAVCTLSCLSSFEAGQLLAGSQKALMQLRAAAAKEDGRGGTSSVCWGVGVSG